MVAFHFSAALNSSSLDGPTLGHTYPTHLHPRNASLTLLKMLILLQWNFDLQNHSGPFTQPLSGFCSPSQVAGWGTLGFPPWGCCSVLGILQLSLPWALAGLEHFAPRITSRASSPPS